MSTALAKIVREAKRIRKAHPNKHKKWKGFVQDASRKYNAGTIGKRKPSRKKKGVPKRVSRKKHVPAKHSPKKRHAKRRSKKRSVSRVGAVSRSRKRRRKSHRTRRVGAVRRSGGGISTGTVVAVGLGALAVYMLTRPKQTALPSSVPPLVTTTNPLRNSQSQDIIAYATAGGLAIDAVIRLINSLNTKSDAEVQAAHSEINETGAIPGWFIA